MEEKALEEVGRGTYCSMLASFAQHGMYQLTFCCLEYGLPSLLCIDSWLYCI
jgi:hypothetical protein